MRFGVVALSTLGGGGGEARGRVHFVAGDEIASAAVGGFGGELLDAGAGGALFAREEGDFPQVEGCVADGFDDGVAHVGDEDCEGGHCQQGPEDEERFAAVGEGFVVAVADGEEGGVGEVDGAEVGPFLLVLAEVEDQGAEEPEEEPGARGDGEGYPFVAGVGLTLDFPHQVEFVASALLFCEAHIGGLGVGFHGCELFGLAVFLNRLQHLLPHFLYLSSSHLLFAAVEDERADRTNEETEDYDADNGVRKEETPTQVRIRSIVADADGQEGVVGKVDGVEELPTFDLCKHTGATYHPYHEANCLQHQRALARGEFEFSGVMALPCAINCYDHQGRNDEIEGRSIDGIVEGLRQSPSVVWDFDYMDDAGNVGDEEEGRYIPADDSDRLCDRKGQAAGHVEQEGEIGDEGEAKGKSVDCQQPGSQAVSIESQTIAAWTLAKGFSLLHSSFLRKRDLTLEGKWTYHFGS